VNSVNASTQPVWASDRAFPESLDAQGWVDPKGGCHPVDYREDLLRLIQDDRAARVVLIWLPDHPRMILPEEWPEAAQAVREGRRKRLLDDLGQSGDRLRWFGLMLGAVTGYMLYQGWRYAAPSSDLVARIAAAAETALRSMSVGLCLLMFLILGFIPWYQTRKRLAEWRRESRDEGEDALRVLRFETWLERQKAPVTKGVMGLMILVGLVQCLPGSALEAAGLMKGGAYQEQWWRVYTAPFLHGNPMHFLMNGAALLYLGRRMEVFARWPHVPLVFLLAAAVGNEASLRFLEHPAVGASGGLMGWLGFLLVFESLHGRLVPRSARRRLLGGVVLTALIGVIGYRFIDNAAHAGGLLAGMLYALVVFPKSSSALRPVANRADVVAGGLALACLTACAGTAIWKILGG
jgi:membrane associated rhomboid family serine protease